MGSLFCVGAYYPILRYVASWMEQYKATQS